MAFILGGRSSRRSCQAWPASWQKCHLLVKPHTHRNRQMVRLLAPPARREDWTRGGGEFDTVPGNSPNSGFEDNPRQDRVYAAQPSFLKFPTTVFAFFCFTTCNFEPRFEHAWFCITLINNAQLRYEARPYLQTQRARWGQYRKRGTHSSML